MFATFKTVTHVLAVTASFASASPVPEETKSTSPSKVEMALPLQGPDEPSGSSNRDPFNLRYASVAESKEDYEDGNVHWLRCEPRTQPQEYRFSVGGSWLAYPVELKKMLNNKKCGVWLFEHRFDNGEDFGDAKLDLAFYDRCDLRDIVDAAVNLTREAQKDARLPQTPLGLYNCPQYASDKEVLVEVEEAAIRRADEGLRLERTDIEVLDLPSSDKKSL
ncbi:hypothetical protein F53441_14352 [Fusarium austroafricanum]|uniref:Uncharacterized protein n=1 Tax=Fusarium austroafricanum TaxID=2364996 RepID=A0A8H4JEI5_9HYPO|nr:hypothetical protein F53441_14352 [Fusarium austroafricanum]